MFKKVLVSAMLSLLIAALVLPTAPLHPALAAQKSQKCSFDFEATVRQGPSKGVALVGKMDFDVAADGALTGKMTSKDGKTINVAGQVVGRAINLVMELEATKDKSYGKYVFGTGTALRPIMGDDDCGGPLGGTFSGPEPGSMGDWGKICITSFGHELICLVVS